REDALRLARVHPRDQVARFGGMRGGQRELVRLAAARRSHQQLYLRAALRQVTVQVLRAQELRPSLQPEIAEQVRRRRRLAGAQPRRILGRDGGRGHGVSLTKLTVAISRSWPSRSTRRSALAEARPRSSWQR